MSGSSPLPLLPHSPEAERAYLGSVLASDAPLELELKPEEFFLPNHQAIYRAMKKLQDGGKPYNDISILYDALSTHIEDCGGVAYLADLMNGIPKVSNLEHYAR